MSLLVALALSQSMPVAPLVLPASAKAVADHVEALYKGDIITALTFVSDNVENSVSDGKSNLHFPAGKAVTAAMYGSITKKGSLALAWFDCRPENEAVRCEMKFGTGKKERNFTLRYFANNGPITKIFSWENHGKKAD